MNGCLLVSRLQPSCRDINWCCCRLHWLFMMSRLQFPCRDITLFTFCFFLNCTCCDPCRDLRQFPFNSLEVTTSQQDCALFRTVSTVQPVAFISALLLTAFLTTYCCIFLLSFFFPVNDTWVSFFIFLHSIYSFLTENKTEKWAKQR